MAVSKSAKALFNNFFEKPEIFAANLISDFLERRSLRKFRNRNFKLTKEQKKEISEFWKPYCKVSPSWAAYYCAANGVFDPRYIPNDMYYTLIDQHFNSRKLGYGFNDKNYYSKIFDGIKQPNTLVRKINGLLFDSEYRQIDADRGREILSSHKEVICKPSQESGSGRGIEFVDTSDSVKINAVLSHPGYDDYIVQELIRQHQDLSRIHPDSINSIRICSLLMDDGVHVLSAVLRMGAGKSRVDNATSGDNAQYGGFSVGINEDGSLKKYSYGYYDGRKSDRHPGGLIFEGYKIPSFDKAVDLVRKAHPRIGHFRLVSWDVAIDDTGAAILIEANMRKGGINFHQFDNGPLFENVMYEIGGGKSLTVRVLDEIFRSSGKK